MDTQLDRIEAKLDALLAERAPPTSNLPRLVNTEALVDLLNVVAKHADGYVFTTAELLTNLPQAHADEIRKALKRVFGMVAPRRFNRLLKENEGRQIGRWLIARDRMDRRACVWKLADTQRPTRTRA